MVRRDRILAFAAGLSGAAALVHELVWTRRLELVLGISIHTTALTLAVTLGGMALGASVAASVEERRRGGARAYAAYELALGLFGLVLPALLGLVEAILPLIAGLPSPVAGVLRTLLPALAILPGALLMGASFPPLVADRLRGRDADKAGALAGLYAANTLGACLGVLAGGLWLRPTLGTQGTLLVACLGSSLSGLLALAAGPEPEGKAPRRRAALALGPDGPTRPGSASVAPFLVYGLAGFAALAYEVMLHRMASLWIGASSYAFTLVLAAFLLGLALGARVYAARPAAPGKALEALGHLQMASAAWALGLAAIAGSIPLWLARFATFEAVSFPLLLTLEFGAILVLVLPGTMLMGAAFPAAAAALGIGAEGSATLVGRLYAANTLGSVTGALAASHLFVDGLGLRGAWLAVSGVNLVAAGVAFMAVAPRARSVLVPALGAAAILAVPDWDAALLSSGPYIYASNYREGAAPGASLADVIRGCGEIVFHRDGAFTTATVRRLPGGMMTLQVNGKTDASTQGDLFTQHLVAHLPLLARPDARDVLVVGLGSGITAGAVLAHPVERLDVVELAPEVVEAAAWFEEQNRGVLKDPRTRLTVGDGRAWIESTGRTYDVISSEPTNPWIAGVANLFTREYFTRCRERLAPGGVMVQWVQAYATSPADFRAVVGTFLEAFPNASLWKSLNETDYVLLGIRGDSRPDGARMEALLQEPGPRGEALRQAGLDPDRLARCFVADRPTLEAWVEGAARVTDDHPFLEFTAPAYLYHDRSDEVRDQLSALADPAGLVGALARGEGLAERGRTIRGALLERDSAMRAAREGRTDEAGRRLEAVLDWLPNDPTASRVLALIRVAQAEEACKADRHGDAERTYASLLRRVPGHPDALNNRALCLVELGRLDEARRELEALVALDPRHAVARGNLGEVCYRAKDYEAAREHYSTYVALRRPGAKEWKNLGEIYRALGDFPRAAHCWSRSVEREPDQPVVRDLLETWIKLAGVGSIPDDLAAGD